MKKTLIVLLGIFLCVGLTSAKAQSEEEARNALMDVVVQSLQSCISNFGGSYRPGTTITDVVQETSSKYIVKGTCNYYGQSCKNVNNTSYKVTIYKEGSQTFVEKCIYTPYCAFGVKTGEGWDCDCVRTQWESIQRNVGTPSAGQVFQFLMILAQ